MMKLEQLLESSLAFEEAKQSQQLLAEKHEPF